MCMSELYLSPLDLLCKEKEHFTFFKTYKINSQEGCGDSFVISKCDVEARLFQSHPQLHVLQDSQSYSRL